MDQLDKLYLKTENYIQRSKEMIWRGGLPPMRMDGHRGPFEVNDMPFSGEILLVSSCIAEKGYPELAFQTGDVHGPHSGVMSRAIHINHRD